MHESMLSYKGSRYLWWASTLCIASIIAYWMHDPLMPANGGTWLGYTLGGIGAFLILLLMWFGIRKRRYSSRLGTLQGWLSAHVYLGIGLITVVTLHTGFQFGWNIHTLAYVLMIGVIMSGMVGVFCYLHFPKVLTDESGETSVESLIRQIQDIDRQALTLASEIDQETHDKVVRSIQKSALGGNALQLLFARGSSRPIEGLELSAQKPKKEASYDPNITSSTMMFMASNIASGRPDKGESMRKLSDLLIGQKAVLQKKLRRDLQLKAFMDIWLYLHVPLSFALLASLIAHVVSVFFYW
jgi:hypothetical protein